MHVVFGPHCVLPIVQILSIVAKKKKQKKTQQNKKPKPSPESRAAYCPVSFSLCQPETVSWSFSDFQHLDACEEDGLVLQNVPCSGLSDVPSRPGSELYTFGRNITEVGFCVLTASDHGSTWPVSDAGHCHHLGEVVSAGFPMGKLLSRPFAIPKHLVGELIVWFFTCTFRSPALGCRGCWGAGAPFTNSGLGLWPSPGRHPPVLMLLPAESPWRVELYGGWDLPGNCLQLWSFWCFLRLGTLTIVSESPGF